jgi:hypothetical protein
VKDSRRFLQNQLVEQSAARDFKKQETWRVSFGNGIKPQYCGLSR